VTARFLHLPLLLLFIVNAATANAQTAQATHVFPQIVDGRQTDGAAYISQLWIANVGGFVTTCTLTVHGFGVERLVSGSTVTIPVSSWTMLSTRGQDAIASGYAVLTCSQPVFASLTYSLSAADGTPLGGATVLSARQASYALLPMALNGHYRYGIAIANDNDAPLVAALIVSGVPGSGGRTIQVPARSQYLTFVDEVFDLPAQGTGMLEIVANGTTGSANFNVTGLRFDRGVFTTLVPATNP
jgi:hypothetical protein